VIEGSWRAGLEPGSWRAVGLDVLTFEWRGQGGAAGAHNIGGAFADDDGNDGFVDDEGRRFFADDLGRRIG
jgi:hypothetical protein